jgi:predicted extracellular nuclease
MNAIMKRIISPLAITIIFIVAFACTAQMNEPRFTVAFYNVENLFDYKNDPAIDDERFLPDSKIPWTAERYGVKLDRLAEVISSIDPDHLPALIGLCEVENRNVLEDLVGQPALREGRYKIVHYDSPDERGIDNALLYNKKAFQVIDSRPIPVYLTKDPDDATRDILYVKGLVRGSSTDTLHIFVNHWPSRSEGKEESEPNRIDAARTLRTHVDSLFALNNWANIVIMGDFNDEPYDTSVHDVLDAFNPTYNPKTEITLYNLMTYAYHQGQGTIYYNQWQVFDQIILSTNLIIKETGLVLTDFEGKIFSADWMLYKASDGTLRPNRTAAREYYGGYSDHLPVYVEFEIK